MDTPQFSYVSDGFYGLGNSPNGVEILWVDMAVTPREQRSMPTLSLPESWRSPTGLYLFLTVMPGDLATVRSQLQELLQVPAYSQARFLWLQNPDTRLSQWQFESLSIDRDQLPRLATFDLGGYALTLPRQTTVKQIATGWEFSAPTAYVTTEYGSHRLNHVDETIILSLVGDQAGCWQFQLTLQRSKESQNYADLAALDIACRLFFPDPLFSTEPDLAVTEQVYQSLRYPLFDETVAAQDFYQEDIILLGHWDPLSLKSDRSFFTFITKDGLGPPLPSGYRSNLGYTIYLTPQRQSRLVFAAKPGSSLEQTGGLYLLPEGEFVLTVPRHANNPAITLPDYGNNLMCGLSGVEYIKLLDSGTYIIGFIPKQPGFAPRYTPVQELTQRLQDLVSIQVNRPIAQLQRWETLQSLFGGNSAQEIESIKVTLLGEFFALSYRLPADSQESLRLLSVSETATLGEFEAWFQAVLRASRARWDSGETAADNTAALMEQTTTSWAYIRRLDRAAEYYAQPDLSILYKPSDQTDLLNFMEVSTTDLATGKQPDSFPLLPYGSLPTALTDCRQLELQVVNPVRREKIRQFYEQAADATLVGMASVAASPRITSRSTTSTTVVSHTASTVTGTTPQGLLVTFKDDFSQMTELVLARSTRNGSLQDFKFRNIIKGSSLWSAFQTNQLVLVVDNADALEAYFNDPDADTEGNGTSNTTTQLTIDGWTFSFDTVDDEGNPLWREESILIFKYHNKPLLELIEQPSLWSQAETFVGDTAKVAEVRQRVRQYLENAIANDTEETPLKTRERYAPLAKIARSADWSGIVALNVPVPPSSGLPEELVALAGGINENQFFAQYVGIDNTPIRPENGSLVVEQSSLFGLIDYVNDQPPEPNDSGYNFQVLSLRVLFENSRITDFSSEIAVTLDQLFGERTQLQEDSEVVQYTLDLIVAERFTDLPSTGKRMVAIAQIGSLYHVRIFDANGNRVVDKGQGQFLPDKVLTAKLDSTFTAQAKGHPLSNSRGLIQDVTSSLGHNLSGRNLVKLQGSTENHNGRTTYAFSFSGSNRFRMPNSGIFNYIDIVKAQFSSDPVPSGPNPTITGRFSFWTRLNFRKLETFDVLSFGPDGEFPTESEEKQFLSAANLVVALSFPRNSTRDRSFTFIPDNLSFHLPASDFRPTSLYAKFPLTLTGFIQGTGKPQGFLPIKTALGNVQLSNTTPWYGLSFELDLGNLGALSSVSKLVSGLVVLWLPNTNPEADTRSEPQVYIGMQLPGLSGDVLGFSLQSVLKLSFKTAEFLFDPSDGPENATYLLKLKAIVLKLLVLSLPPNGQTELLIFGNSKGRDHPIGWYAAYAKTPSQKPP